MGEFDVTHVSSCLAPSNSPVLPVVFSSSYVPSKYVCPFLQRNKRLDFEFTLKARRLNASLHYRKYEKSKSSEGFVWGGRLMGKKVIQHKKCSGTVAY